MSSDQRIKKLRGSGGYVMASVDDEQQKKGSLGGPDLFLAPIGRLDSEKISKYFCNTCEKDYDGSPKIEYENPNEEVAENLILAERGQYVCGTCGSTLAEYRDFVKPDEQVQVGMAKPESEAAFAGAPPAPDLRPADLPQEMAEDPSVSSIVGMSVFDENGIKLGVANQVGVDSARNIVVVITGNDGGEQTVPWSRVKKIGEIILLGGPATQADSAATCPGCGFENKADSKFCEQCGNKI